MNSFLVALFSCLVVFTTAVPIGIWGGHGGPVTLIGASGIVGPNGAAGPSGIVNRHGAIGPNGVHSSWGHHGIIAAPALVGGLGIGGQGGAIIGGAHGLGYGYGLGYGGMWY